jgi:Tol biopolymer transport system component
MALAAGTRFGSYEIVGAIGAGGMGEVYRARDTKLGRDVALKVLPESFANDPDRLARFEREARTLAALNHPNIATIHGLEEAQGIRALVMELVEGSTLSDRIAHGPIPVDEALPIAKQIADALETAHERGIVHRDLKPANIILSADGRAKVLDFGLAKPTAAQPSTVSLFESPTLTNPVGLTEAGILLGTAAYMAPEQARGRSVDKRADIWAFGCVVFEMLTGQSPFSGDDASQVLARVIEREPDWNALPGPVSPALLLLLRRCLQKDPKQRIRDMGDVRLLLEGAFDSGIVQASGVAAAQRRFWRPMVSAIIAVTLAAATGLIVWSLSRPRVPAIVRLTIAASSGEAIAGTNQDASFAISPDGERVVFVTDSTPPHLYVRALDDLNPRLLSGVGSPRAPFVSPDGRWIGFFDGVSNVMKKIAMNGGPVFPICDVIGDPGATGGGPRGASWASDGTIIFATNDGSTGLLRVSAAGGKPEVLTKPDTQKGEADHFWPEVLPGGNAVLFTIVSIGGAPAATARAIDNAQIAVLDLRTGGQKILIQGGSYPRYVRSGHIVYGAAGALRAINFDLDRLEVRGDPVLIQQSVVTTGIGAANFSIASDGSLVYLAGSAAGPADRAIVWVDRQGREEPVGAPRRQYMFPRISPDGSKVAVDSRDENLDIWIWDFGRTTLTRLTFDPGLDTTPVWTRDGSRIVFTAHASSSLFWKAADGTGTAEQLTASSNALFPSSFSPDGTRLVLREQQPGQGFDMSVLVMDAERRVRPLIQTSFNEVNADISPDGRWMAYQSNESGTGRFEVYVRPFPDVDSGKWQISSGGGGWPVWARSGRELFYFVGSGRTAGLMSVPIQPGATFTWDKPRLLFEGPYIGPNFGRSYDVSPDGSRFLMIKDDLPSDAAPAPQLVVVQNWFEELKRLVPTQ